MGGGYAFAHSSTICFYYTTIFFFCQVFYTTFLELFRFIFLFSVTGNLLAQPPQKSSLPPKTRLGSRCALSENKISFYFLFIALLLLASLRCFKQE
jgi:hypothetical protein